MIKKTKQHSGVSWIPVLLAVILMIGGTTLYVFWKNAQLCYHGPYVAYSRQALAQLPESGLKRTLAELFYSSEEIEQIQTGTIEYSRETASEINEDGIEIHRLKGTTYQGVMMIVHNPEEVIVATNPHMDSGEPGYTLEKYIAMNEGIAGINAGGFEDEGGNGNGGQAYGIVISGGELISGRLNEYTPVIGINSENKLVVGDMTAQQALDWDIQEAVTFGPVFIKDFEVVFDSGRHPGLNPRTVIGQRPDGAMLLLVLDGRQPVSFGSTYQDIIDIMLDFGAMTAANLDGGNSTVMIYDEETRNSTVSIYGDRRLPTAFVVKKGAAHE